MAIKIQLRRGTAAEWTSANPVLMQGEMGVETDTLKVKLGNGTSSWSALPYFTQGLKGDTGAKGEKGDTGVTGAKGDVGETGPANTLTVGTVTTGAAGSSAVVTISGDAPNQTISFTIPQGLQGIQGIQGVKGDTGTGIPAGGTTGQIVVKTVDGTAWTDLPPSSLAGQSDVTITSPQAKQVLKFDGTEWVNATASGGVTVSESTPVDPSQGDGWFFSADGTQFIRYDDGSGTPQWVQPNAVLSSQIEQRYYSPNYLINGAFEINQRAFSSTTSNGAFGFDRWLMTTIGGTGTATYSGQALSAGAIADAFSSNFARLVTAGQTAPGTATILRQRIEDVRTIAGKNVTISFWARSGTGSPKVAVELSQIMGTGGSSDVNTYAGQVTLSSAWERHRVTVQVPSVASATIGSGSYLGLSLWVSAGSDFNSRTGSIGIQSNTFDFWGVQVEEGTSASPFRRNANSLQGELAACQRYFQRYSGESAAVAQYASGIAYSTAGAFYQFFYRVPFRVAPTSLSSNGTFRWGNGVVAGTFTSLSMAADTATTHGCLINAAGSSGLTGGAAVRLDGPSALGGFIDFSAEL